MNRILPMPLKLYEQLLLALIEDGEGDNRQGISSETLGRIVTFLEKRKTRVLHYINAMFGMMSTALIDTYLSCSK